MADGLSPYFPRISWMMQGSGVRHGGQNNSCHHQMVASRILNGQDPRACASAPEEEHVLEVTAGLVVNPTVFWLEGHVAIVAT